MRLLKHRDNYLDYIQLLVIHNLIENKMQMWGYERLF